jgi:hypothetical protein
MRPIDRRSGNVFEDVAALFIPSQLTRSTGESCSVKVLEECFDPAGCSGCGLAHGHADA